MSEILSIKPETAKFDPASEFSSPAELAASSALTRGEKIAALERWSQEIADRLAATNGGMETDSTSAAETKLLDEVNRAMADLIKS